ncbi:MAG: hypothetical protein IT350_14320 [Deltaproteobacteria bacterium]|nr:hypothetical protein [Deltaproteobacteria bacterium]
MTSLSHIDRWSWLIVVAVAVALGAPMFGPYLIYGHSADIDAYRLLVFDAAIRTGDLFPRWVPHYYFGYGSPIFHFYGPLPYYVAEAFVLAGADAARALQCTLFATWLAAALAMFLLARDFLSRPASVAAGVLYLLAPYHLVDLNVRHALGEHVAFIWIPLAIWGCAGGIKRPGAARFAVGALAIAALPLTHNITAMISLPVICAWCAFDAYRARSVGKLALAALSVASGLAVSAFFWLPAFVEKDLVFARESLTEEFFQFGHHFVHATQLFWSPWGFGGSRPGIADDRMSFQIGLVHWAGVLATLTLLYVTRKRWRADRSHPAWPSLAAVAVFAGAAFMTTPASVHVWHNISLLSFVQFPWRFLTLAAFGSSLVAAYAIDAIPWRAPRWAWFATLAVIGACAVAYGSWARPRAAMWHHESRHVTPVKIADIRTLDASVYGDMRTRLTLAHVVTSGDTGTSRDDYLPRTVNEKPIETTDALAWVLETGEEPTITRVGPNRFRFDVSTSSPAHLLFNQFSFPGWEARIDGEDADTLIDNRHGAIIVPVPEGRHEVEIAFGSTPLRDSANRVSLYAIVALVAGALYAGFANRGRPKPPAVPIQSNPGGSNSLLPSSST